MFHLIFKIKNEDLYQFNKGREMLKILMILILFVFEVRAENMVDIFGSANTRSGKQNEAHFSFEEENTPIFVIDEVPPTQKPKEEKEIVPAQKNTKEINQFSEQNPKPFAISPEAEKNEIENTLYEGGDRIYDVQSFPLKDIKIITEPNIDPTISTYPEY